MPSKTWRAYAALAATALLLAACATPDYAKQARSFSEGVASTSEAFAEMRSVEREASIREQATLIIAARHAVDLSCDVVTDVAGEVAAAGGTPDWRGLSTELSQGGPCALDHFGFTPAAQEQGAGAVEVVPLADGPIDLSSQAENSAALLGSIADYAKALADVAGAEDIGQLDEGIGQLAGALGGLASEVGQQPGSDFSGLVSPAAAAVQWIGGNYLNHKRRKALLRAVGEADKLMEPAEDKLGALTFALQVSTLQNRMTAIDADIGEFFQRSLAAYAAEGEQPANRARREALMQRIIDGYLDLIALKQAQPTAAVMAMRDAHAALLEAIADGRSLKTAFRELKAFGEIVRELHAQVRDLI